MEPLPLSAWVSIGVAVASLVVVPLAVHFLKAISRAVRKAKAAELAAALAPYATKVEQDVRFDRMEQAQNAWVQEQREMLGALRSEAHHREVQILNRLDRLTERVDEVVSWRAIRKRGRV